MDCHHIQGLIIMAELMQLLAERNAQIYTLAAWVLGLVLVWQVVAARLPAPIATSGAASSPRFGLPPLQLSIWFPHWPAIIIGLGVLVRVLNFDTGPYWYDETFSVWLAQLPLERVVSAVAGDVHPPLFYSLTWLMARLAEALGQDGTSPYFMRLLPLAFGVAGLVLTWRVGQLLKLKDAALCVALVLMALSPFQVFYSFDVRMYSLMQLLTLWAVWALLEKRWVQLGAAFALMLYTHNYGLLFAAGVGALALFKEWRERGNWLAPLWAGVGAVALYLPWVAVLKQQMSNVAAGHWIWPATLADVLMLPHTLTLGSVPAESAGFGLLLVVFVLALAPFALWRDKERWPLVWLVIAPVALALVISVLYRPIFVTRYLFAVSPYWFLLAGWVVSVGLGVRGRLALACIALPLFIFPSIGRVETLERGQPVQVERVIREGWQAGDVIIHTDVWTALEAGWRLRDLPNVLFPPAQKNLNVGGLTEQTRLALGIPEARLPATFNRAWIVVAYAPTVNAEERRAALDELLAARRSERVTGWFDKYQLQGVELYLVYGR